MFSLSCYDAWLCPMRRSNLTVHVQHAPGIPSLAQTHELAPASNSSSSRTLHHRGASVGRRSSTCILASPVRPLPLSGVHPRPLVCAAPSRTLSHMVIVVNSSPCQRVCRATRRWATPAPARLSLVVLAAGPMASSLPPCQTELSMYVLPTVTPSRSGCSH